MCNIGLTSVLFEVVQIASLRLVLGLSVDSLCRCLYTQYVTLLLL